MVAQPGRRLDGRSDRITAPKVTGSGAGAAASRRAVSRAGRLALSSSMPGTMPPLRAVLAALLALAVLGALPAAALAHSELVASTPADGEVLSTSPAEIAGEFSAPVDAGRSSMELRGPDGDLIARGGVREGGLPTRMIISGVPDLEQGTYTVRWTTVTADDNGVERGTFLFTVEVAGGSPTSSPAPTAGETAKPGPPFTPPPASLAAASPADSPAPSAAQRPAGGPGDIVVPLAVLGAVLAGGAAWLAALLRRRE
jgi:methionine-rich copper-binding protein CopC